MLPFATTLYQIKNSTVSFTNKSLKTTGVTGWSWQLDSGSGFVEVATTENASITFPDVAGLTCTVKLVASGGWGDSIEYERQYITVEDIPAPVITLASVLPAEIGEYFDAYVTIQEGTGAGDITWDFPSGQCPGINIDTSTGRLWGIPQVVGLFQIALIATDSLGRTTAQDTTITVTAPAVTFTLSPQVESSIVKDIDNKVSFAYDLALAANNYYFQNIAAYRPVFGNDGFHNYIEFSEDVHSLNIAGTGWSSAGGVIMVVDIRSLPVSGFQAILGASANAADGRNAWLATPAGVFLMNAATTPIPAGGSGKIILSEVQYGSSGNRRTFINGVPACSLVAYNGVSAVKVFETPLGYISGAYTKKSARFRLY